MESRGRRRWGVEPTMFLYMLAYMLTSVVEEDMIVYKACTATHGYDRLLCANISQPRYQTEKQLVQVTVAWYHMWENVASQAVPAVLALFLGSWSDRVGRKIPLLMGLTGGLIYSAALLVNSLAESWRLEWILLTGAVPCGLSGGPLAVFMAAYSYLADTTSPSQRTFRTTLLEVSYLVTMPTGVALGSYLFTRVVDGSHAVMFALNCGCLVASILYSWLALEWKTAVVRPPHNCAGSGQVYSDSCACAVTVPPAPGPAHLYTCAQPPPSRVFSPSLTRRWRRWAGEFVVYICRHVSDSIKTVVRPRPEHRRQLLHLCLLSLALYTFQREEKHSIYLYTQLRFHWDLATYSTFRTFQSLLYILGLLVGVPVLNKVLGVRDTIIMMIGAASHIAARIAFSLATNKQTIYAGSALGLLGPIVAPVIRSSVSKLVPSYERGKVFALLSVSDLAVAVVSGALYSLVYSSTLFYFPQAVFILTIASQILVFSTAMWMECLLKGEVVVQASDDTLPLPSYPEDRPLQPVDTS